MSRLLKLCALAVAVLAVTGVMAAGDEPVGQVLELTDENFDKIVPEHEVLLVEFYAPWCGHCKALAPKYDEAAKLLAENDATKNVRIAKIDAEAEKKTGGKYGVSGFPTIKLFRNGEVAGEFEGERTAEGIVNFMKIKAAAAVNKPISDAAALKQIVKNPSKPVLVALCSSKDHVDYKLFKGVVARVADVGLDVYHSEDASVLEAFGYYGNGCSIQLYRQASDKSLGLKSKAKVTYQGTVFKEKLREWILENALTPFAAYTPETQKLFALLGKNIVRIVRTDKASLDLKDLVEKTKDEQKDFVFALSNAADYKADVEAHCEPNAVACILIQDSKKNRVYGKAEGATVTADSLKQFIADFRDKKLKVKIKSEAIPAPAKEGEVHVVVGASFQQEVIESDKDVFIEFYAPWCGHCKALAPKWDDLAQEMKEDSNLVIAKFEATANDIPPDYKDAYQVSGFPTIYFGKKGKKTSPIKYEGDRDVAAFKKWLEEKRA